MFPVFALIFLIVPIVEIYILIQIGQIIGAVWTIFFVVLTAIIGVQLLKSQGLSTLSRAQHKMDQGELPAVELIEGIALIVAGALLLTPGFFTDAVGFLLLFRPTRLMLVQTMSERLLKSGRVVMNGEQFRGSESHQQQRGGDVIDGVNYRREDDN